MKVIFSVPTEKLSTFDGLKSAYTMKQYLELLQALLAAPRTSETLSPREELLVRSIPRDGNVRRTVVTTHRGMLSLLREGFLAGGI